MTRFLASDRGLYTLLALATLSSTAFLGCA